MTIEPPDGEERELLSPEVNAALDLADAYIASGLPQTREQVLARLATPRADPLEVHIGQDIRAARTGLAPKVRWARSYRIVTAALGAAAAVIVAVIGGVSVPSSGGAADPAPSGAPPVSPFTIPSSPFPDQSAPTEGIPSSTPGFGSEYLGQPVDGATYVQAPVDEQISGVEYPVSVNLRCPADGPIDWNVSGYTRFTTVVGIPDDGVGPAVGVTNTVTFADQNGRVLDTVTTAIGQPQPVSIDLRGVQRLVITCVRHDSNGSGNNLITMGNAVLSGG